MPEGVPVGERIRFDGFDGPPEAVLNPKKKLWEKIAPDLKTNAGVSIQAVPPMYSRPLHSPECSYTFIHAFHSFNCSFILSFIHSFIPRFPIRRSGALQQTFYGSPPACPVLGFPRPCSYTLECACCLLLKVSTEGHACGLPKAPQTYVCAASARSS